MNFQTLMICLVAGLGSLHATAQTYAIDWYKVAGGGGTSTGGIYEVSGTIGQPDASGAISGGNFAITGGYWALIQVLQTPGAPALKINHAGNVVTVYWQNVEGWNLQQNNSLTAPASWSVNNGAILNGGTNYLMLTNPPGNRFFRLSNP